MLIASELLKIGFLGLCFLQGLFWIIIFLRLTFWTSRKKSFTATTSLIICSKNDKYRLSKALESAVNQKSALQEIIVVDDFSIDDTKNYVESLQKQHKNLIYHKAYKDHPGKKLALDSGIHRAKSEFILLTDADCIASDSWFSTLSREIGGDKKIVLGHAPFHKLKTWLNKWSRFENLITAFQYLSFAMWKIPYMGVGRNLLYAKSIYTNTDHLGHHIDIPSGDDDLFINQVADKNNTTICLDPKSFVYSDAKETWSAYLRQKKRHYGSSSKLKNLHKFLISVFSISHILTFLCIIALFLMGEYYFAIVVYFFRTLVFWLSFMCLAPIFKEKDLIIYFPILDLMLFLHYLYFSFYVLFPSKTKW